MANNSIKILVIDDLQDNLITVNALIKDAFPEAITINAQSGKKGLELAAKENPDVILLDILMPGMDGYEVCEKLKAHKELCDIPVVFVTAIENNKEALVKALESGGEAFLTKPIDEIELTAQIRAMLKIREANNAKKDEKVRLEQLVEERSKELVKELAARKQAEEESLRYQTFLKSSLESFKDIIVLSIDKNYKYLYFNKTHIEVMQYAYNKDIEIGMNLLDCMTSEDDIRKAKVNYDRALAGESHSTIEAYGDAQRSYYETFYNPIRNEKNEIIGTTAMARDITNRMQAEEKLKESEATVRKKLKAMLEPEGDINSLELSDIIDVEVLQSMMDDFYRITGMLGAVLDVSGKVLVAVGWQDICTKFHRCHPDTLKNCLESDTVLTNGVAEGEFKSYRCKNNMWDIVTPIMIGGKHLGNVFMGQYFLEGEVPDIELFRKQAKKYSFDEAAYLAALDRVPRFNKETVKKGMQFYSKLAKIISKLSFSSFQQSRMLAQQKQAEAELIKLSTAVKQSPSVIAITDTKGNQQYVNPKYTEITGFSFEEVIGKNPRILKSGEQSDIFYKELWETVSSGKEWRGEFHNKKKNGELFWELASVSPIFDEQGKIVNYIKVAEDITERKQAEDNFRHSIDESPLGIRIVNQAGKTIYVNKALLDIYELSSPDEFLNTRAIETYTEKSYQDHQERKKFRQEGGDAYDYEISIRRKNGEIRHIKVWRKEVIWNREKHFQVINQDITELKRLNTDLILAKEKAEESNRLKTAFLNNMSHEIRTPLNGITGFIGLLQDSEIDDEKKQHYFNIINKSSDRLIATVTDIIDISRIEAGEVKVSKTEVSVNKILEELYNFFYHEAESKGLELTYKTNLSDREARFVTDKNKLEGILTNLIKNAIKFTDQGEITLACSLKKEQEIDVLEFYVKDTGIGIPSNRIDAIFNRFEQADIEDTGVYEGSGLGLAISKAYVEMLGGEISVSSKEGEGSTFTFSIPYTKQLVKESDAKGNINKEPQIALSNLSVIIAEDDEASIMYFEAIFKNEFKNITYTKTGKETIDRCRVTPETDLILMDIKMPGLNGYDATREIRNFNSDVIIIAQTAFGLTGDREKAIEAGCNDYIAKPIKKDNLEIIIKKHFKNYKKLITN